MHHEIKVAYYSKRKLHGICRERNDRKSVTDLLRSHMHVPKSCQDKYCFVTYRFYNSSKGVKSPILIDGWPNFNDLQILNMQFPSIPYFQYIFLTVLHTNSMYSGNKLAEFTFKRFVIMMQTNGAIRGRAGKKGKKKRKRSPHSHYVIYFNPISKKKKPKLSVDIIHIDELVSNTTELV